VRDCHLGLVKRYMHHLRSVCLYHDAQDWTLLLNSRLYRAEQTAKVEAEAQAKIQVDDNAEKGIPIKK